MVVKKQIANYSNRRQINIKKEDNLKDVSEVFLYTSEEHKNINSRINALNEDVATTKQQLDNALAKIQAIESSKQQDIAEQVAEVNADAEAMQQHHQKQLEEIYVEHNQAIKQVSTQLINQRNDYESLLKDKEATIKDKESIINDKDNIIAKLQQQVKNYEDKAIEVADIIATYNEANIEKTERHNKEVNALKEANIFITSKYNGLRQAIINKSSLSLLFGGKKQLLIEYQEEKPSDDETIEANATTTSDNTAEDSN